MTRRQCKIGSPVRIAGLSGIDSGKRGYIVDPQYYGHCVDNYRRQLIRDKHWLLIALCQPGFVSTCYQYTVIPANRLTKES